MYKESDQVTEFNKSALNTVLQLTQIALHSTERLVDLQLGSTKQTLADAHHVLQPETDLWDVPTLFNLRNKLTEKSVENATVYLRNLYDVAAYTKNQIAELITVQWRDWTQNTSSGVSLGINSVLELMLPKPAPVAGVAAHGMHATAEACATPEPTQAIVATEGSAVAVEATVPVPFQASVEESTFTEAAQPLAEDSTLADAAQPLVEGNGLNQETVAAVAQTDPILEPVLVAPVQTDNLTLNVAPAYPQTKRTAMSAADFSVTRAKSVSSATRAEKNTKPATEKTKPVAAKKKQTTKR